MGTAGPCRTGAALNALFVIVRHTGGLHSLSVGAAGLWHSRSIFAKAPAFGASAAHAKSGRNAMSANHFLEARPPMWWIEADPADHQSASAWGDRLFLGGQSCRLEDIIDYDVVKTARRDNDGLMISGLGFLGFALFFLNMILVHGWSSRFWIGVAFCAFFAMISLVEAFFIEPVTLYELTVALEDGTAIHFASSDADDLARLLGVIDAAVAAR